MPLAEGSKERLIFPKETILPLDEVPTSSWVSSLQAFPRASQLSRPSHLHSHVFQTTLCTLSFRFFEEFGGYSLGAVHPRPKMRKRPEELASPVRDKGQRALCA